MQTTASNGSSPRLASAKDTPGGTMSASPPRTSLLAPSRVAVAAPARTTKTSSASSVCSGLTVPGSRRTRQALVLCAPRLGEARPTAWVPPTSKRGAWASVMTGMGGSVGHPNLIVNRD
jgi:hypothetical protein